MIKVLIVIPFYKRYELSALCFTHYDLICKEIMNEMSDVDMKLVLAGSEGKKSRDLALNFVDSEYYLEIPQKHKGDDYKSYFSNLVNKYIDTIKAIKNIPHDIVFQSGSDDFVTIDFYRQAIDIFKSGNDVAAFCNGVYNEVQKKGGMLVVNYKNDKGVLLESVNKRHWHKKFYSKSTGSYGYTKKALELMKYIPGSDEVRIEKSIHDAKVEKFIILQRFWDIKVNMTHSKYEAYYKQRKRNISIEELNEYTALISKLKENLPKKLQIN